MKCKHIVLIVGIFSIVGALLALIFINVRNSFQPASENAPTTKEGVRGVPTLERKVLVSGLSNVWDAGFLSDETILFSERVGTISKLQGGKKVVVHTVANVYARGEGGLLGMVVDPEFNENRFIYACYSTAQDVRVSRWVVNEDATALTDQVNIVTDMPVNTSVFPGRHSGCRPRFGADNNLWIGTGDTAKGTAPQDPKSLGGKILRVDRNGRGVTGNLNGEFDARVYSYGHRNVQGLAMFSAPKNGVYGYSVEHGPNKNDEINPLKSGNMGWNPVPLYNELVAMTDKNKYPSAVSPLWESGNSTIAPSGSTFLIGTKWGVLEGRLAVAVLKNQHLRLFELDGTEK